MTKRGTLKTADLINGTSGTIDISEGMDRRMSNEQTETTDDEVIETEHMEPTSGETAKKPKAEKPQAFCLFSGQPTNGGRFRPGYDAKMKSALQARFRDENAEIAVEGMSDALRERFATGDLSTKQGAHDALHAMGWGHFATEKPKAKPKATASGQKYEIRDTNGAVLKKVKDDPTALEYVEANGLELVETGDGFVVVTTKAEADGDDHSDAEEPVEELVAV